ncbi:hypothetical protein F0Q45_23180 [Mycobacterium simiae]|uniref:Uncharacterized protein n=1 Tax=Mycobacterium simiae TaxID=1784 RepID=A0A5B1BDD2_MYCSI|nr:hypothetical protein [Mycobacterium simiae]KAA1246588.1 hypothetical protein F0Q45_23180 [Mycobacterium simiae]
MLLALPLIPSVGAQIGSGVMAEMGMLPEVPVHPVVHFGAIAHGPDRPLGQNAGLHISSAC